MVQEAVDPLRASVGVSERAPALAHALVAGTQPPVSREDASHHFAFLAHALEFGRPHLFARYVAWCKPTQAHRNVPCAALAAQFEAMAQVLQASLPAPEAAVAIRYLREALAAFPQAPESIHSTLGKIPAPAQAYLERLLANDTGGATGLAREHLHGSGGVADLYMEVLAPAMNEVGRLWQCDRVSVAQEHYCAGVTQMVMGEAAATLRSLRGDRTAVVACVAGEQHSLGSRMVADFLDMTGWRTLWLGASTPGSDLLRMVVESGADLLALSCSHAPCMHDVATLITALRVLPECAQVKVLVGGYAFEADDGLWRDVGADGFAPDAAAAARVAHRLVASAAPRVTGSSARP